MNAIRTPPVLALVGRPNVGKSALFNRLTRRRLAIVHASHGVTRDRIAADAEWEGRPLRLVDTGGVGVLDDARIRDTIAAGTRAQVAAALAEADGIVHVVDAQAGLTPLDLEVGRLLHRAGRPAVVAANKADNDALAAQAAEFAQLGRDVFPVSALHGRGIGALMEAICAQLPEAAAEAGPEEEGPLRVVVLGRPNAGKSSYINRLLGEERVIVSEIPGTTRDSIEIPFAIAEPDGRSRRYVLCDTAGLRRQGRSRDAVEHYSRLRVEDAVHRADLAALLFDATEGPSRQDKRIAALVGEKHKACVLIVNKWDLAGGQTQKAYAAAVRDALPFLAHAPLVFISARTGYRVAASVRVLDRAAAAYARGVGTGLLNRKLHEAFERVPPPRVRERRMRFYYAVQTGTRPPRFRLFVNNPALRTPAYEHYLVNRVRRELGFEGAPVLLQFAPRTGERSRPAANTGGSRAARRAPAGPGRGGRKPSGGRDWRPARGDV